MGFQGLSNIEDHLVIRSIRLIFDLLVGGRDLSKPNGGYGRTIAFADGHGEASPLTLKFFKFGCGSNI